jgi:hypothetical protein
MINTTAVTNPRIALDATIARLNIERFCKIFTDEANETKRRTLLDLIAEEKAKLDTLIALVGRKTISGPVYTNV